jgi:transposase-like protein
MTSAFVCPFCQSPRVTAISIEGQHNNVTRFRCAECERTWSEAIAGGRRTPPHVAPEAPPLK